MGDIQPSHGYQLCITACPYIIQAGVTDIKTVEEGQGEEITETENTQSVALEREELQAGKAEGRRKVQDVVVRQVKILQVTQPSPVIPSHSAKQVMCKAKPGEVRAVPGPARGQELQGVVAEREGVQSGQARESVGCHRGEVVVVHQEGAQVGLQIMKGRKLSVRHANYL